MLKRSLVSMPRIQYGVKPNASALVTAWKQRIKVALNDLHSAHGPAAKAVISAKLRYYRAQLKLARKEKRHAIS